MEDPTAADAEFAVSFATQFAVDIEAQVGTLQSPFGRDYWL
jgi:hypothetical protein